MAENYHEKLANVIMKEILQLEDKRDYGIIDDYCSRVGEAMHFATTRSTLECDLKKFNKKEDWSVFDEDYPSEYVKELSEKIGHKDKVRFKTKKLFDCLLSRVIDELQVLREPWETAILIYALGGLYDSPENEKLKQTVAEIKDEKQRRFAAICARVYVEGYEVVFDIFCPGTEI